MSDQYNQGVRVDLDGRVFHFKVTTAGYKQVTERATYAPGTPYQSYFNRTIWHGGKGRPPTKMARRVLEAAGVAL